MSTAKGQEKTFVDKLKEELESLSEKFGMDSKIVLSVLSVCLFFVFIGYFDFYITSVIGIAYPAFWSIKAIESSESGDDKQWLTYWVVFASFSFVDLFSGFVLRFIPFYFFFKLAFLLWCMMPTFKGATVIYDNIIIKLFKKYEKVIVEKSGNLLNEVTNKAKDVQKEVAKNINTADLIKTGMAINEKLNKTD
jgi:receptor expression-enhancing protein 5/6